jgi:hypothetical protein
VYSEGRLSVRLRNIKTYGERQLWVDSRSLPKPYEPSRVGPEWGIQDVPPGRNSRDQGEYP